MLKTSFFKKLFFKLIIINSNSTNGNQLIESDYKNFFHHIDSRNSKSNLNVVISSHLITSEQFEKASEIIEQYHQIKTPFT